MLTTSIALAFASLAFAQEVFLTETFIEVVTVGTSVYTTTSASTYPAATSTGTPTTHTIVVGPTGTLTYSPNNITAGINDVVEFKFSSKNHTVNQSNFGKPCETLEKSTGVAGFISGFMPTNNTLSADNATMINATFSFVVNSTAPIWGYCAQTNPVPHCGKGMVFSVNAPTTGNMTFEKYLELAKATGANSTSSATPSGSGIPSGTGSGATSSSTDDGTNSNAISTSVNGLTAVLAAVGVAFLAL